MNGLKASIERDGFLSPIVVRKKGKSYEILSGNHRVMALRELGKEEVPCVLIHPCDDARASRIALNMNTVHGDPNVELIAPFLSTMPDNILGEIYFPDALMKDMLAFDETLKLRLDSLEIPDALDNDSIINTIPNCECKCGHRHVAKAASA